VKTARLWRICGRFVANFRVCGGSWVYLRVASGLRGISLVFVVSCGCFLPVSSGSSGFVADIFRKNDPFLAELRVRFGA
jgi:hypothetical protein